MLRFAASRFVGVVTAGGSGAGCSGSGGWRRLAVAGAVRTQWARGQSVRWMSTQRDVGEAGDAKLKDVKVGEARDVQTKASAEMDMQSKALLSREERQQMILSPPALVVTREYEWGNILLGFEQANRYTIRSAPRGDVVGYIAEEDSLGKSLTRNFLRTHRSFKATILDSAGEPFFVLRRPFYVFSTSMYAETPTAEVLGEIHMDWHLYRRRYNMYVDKAQFARIDSGFLAFDFDMRDEENRKIASVNKDFTGFAREIFTDARQYVLRMQPDYAGEDISPDGLVREKIHDDPKERYSENTLTVAQKATILACAVSIDFDYFSLHSHGGGLLGPGIPIVAPIPHPMPNPTANADSDLPPDDAKPGVGTGAGAGAGAGAAAGSEAVNPGMDAESIDPGQQFPAGDDQGQWATFEESKPEFYEPEFDEPPDMDAGDGMGGDEDSGFSGVLGSIFRGFTDSDD
mmetsp:Transcript_5004/g.15013  ORF Transcript_5004/g.15013 Transcript_5004/m.15013 type:complete len:459 (-) Transcript_5004:2603-3979(-)|eukprot:CAMPEP_0198724522 /NCGR_PEP_ID=MMETSP1475-20131203/1981_1 /TAXON_ID= ORGANISM="Unidentified sp., Strain CCMP1999" /NCGR_SAMPLE_ID=MMETSP1475 /ASSEMBLY_ACC=CAM_ASM_001111 /LENGTH=458 /DNA_ID=CAMNT_0044486073 /DNA_START=91 /DNA_END=1467 /DNA_ORIENTATION=-